MRELFKIPDLLKASYSARLHIHHGMNHVILVCRRIREAHSRTQGRAKKDRVEI
jgi:hypothetical protein